MVLIGLCGTADMFPHLLHTKQFLDWRFGRLDDNSDATAGPSATTTASSATGSRVSGVWPVMWRRRHGRRLTARGRRRLLLTSSSTSRVAPLRGHRSMRSHTDND